MIDPRVGENVQVADELESVYQKAFDAYAGPPEFRHSVNRDTYHRAALLAVWEHARSRLAPSSK